MRRADRPRILGSDSQTLKLAGNLSLSVGNRRADQRGEILFAEITRGTGGRKSSRLSGPAKNHEIPQNIFLDCPMTHVVGSPSAVVGRLNEEVKRGSGEDRKADEVRARGDARPVGPAQRLGERDSGTAA